MKKFSNLALAVVFASVLAGCGGGGDSGTDSDVVTVGVGDNRYIDDRVSPSEVLPLPDDRYVGDIDSAEPLISLPVPDNRMPESVNGTEGGVIVGNLQATAYAGAPGTLVRNSYVKMFSLAQVKTAIASDTRFAGIQAKYAVSSYKIVYMTTDKDGAPVAASGLLTIPIKVAGSKSPVISYQHATTFQDAEAPSNKVEATEPTIILASQGYIVVAADYVGFGESKGIPHPYLTAQPTARAVIDMLTASKTFRSRVAIFDNDQLFLTGYSEGGYATMAAHRALVQSADPMASKVVAEVSGAGPYNVQTTMDTLLSSVRNSNSSLAPLAALLQPGLLKYLSNSDRDNVRDALMGELVPANADVVYSPLFIDRYLADDVTNMVAQHNVDTGWKSAAPVLLFHGTVDNTVPYAASTVAKNALTASGSPNVTLTNCTTPNFGHIACVPEYFKFAINKMGELAKDL